MDGLLGPKLLRGSEEVPTLSLAGVGVVGLYFSAHWCPPCKAYTPQLRKVYERAKAKGKSFEIIFVSGDQDDASFRTYFGTMPWYAIPFADEVRKKVLKQTFHISGIPSLVLLTGTGSLLDKSARAKVMAPSFLSTLPRVVDLKDWGPLPSEPMAVMVRHNGQEHEIECEPDEGWELLRMQIFSVTEVPEEQQRLFGLGVVCGPLDESVPLPKALAAGLAAQRGSGLRIADVPDNRRSASSSHNDNPLGTGHHRGRLDSEQAWVPRADDKAAWYQLDLGAVSEVAGIVVAPRADAGQFVTKLRVSCAEEEGGLFAPVDGSREFEACVTMPQQPLRILFASAVRARMVRLEPTACHGGHAALRADVLLAGAEADAPPEIVVVGNASKDDPFEIRSTSAADPSTRMMEEQHLAMLQAKLSNLPPRLQNEVRGLEGAKKYEDRTLQRQALDDIPVCALDQLVRKSGVSEGYDMAFMRKILLWYKKFFFRWTNSPRCEHCNSADTKTIGTTAPNQEEQSFGAGTVEVAQCNACGGQTRFPRYNDPGKLLEWRQGRCGEWANCFTLVCRALGYEARHVHDWTDHVWTEVYCDSSQRWLHADSCEEALDTPLVYEQGWGKKLTYCLAFARDHAVDVTQRYTRKYEEVLTRRNQFAEQDLRRAMVAINEFAMDRAGAALPQAVAEQRRGALEQRGVREEEEFKANRNAQTGPVQAAEQIGRTSGDAQWREQRGELGANADAKAKALQLSEQGLACVSAPAPGADPAKAREEQLQELVQAKFQHLCDSGKDHAEAAAAALADAATFRTALEKAMTSTVRDIRDYSSDNDWKALTSIGSLQGELLLLSMAVRWRDQGFGNQKGRVRALLRRSGSTLGEVDCFGIAPHEVGDSRKQLYNVAGIKPLSGDTIAFEYVVGGGGGHQLHIEQLTLSCATLQTASAPQSDETRAAVKAKFAEHLTKGLSPKEAMAALLADPPKAAAAAQAAAGKPPADAQARMKARFAELVASGLPPNEAAARMLQEAKQLQQGASPSGDAAASQQGVAAFKPPARDPSA